MGTERSANRGALLLCSGFAEDWRHFTSAGWRRILGDQRRLSPYPSDSDTKYDTTSRHMMPGPRAFDWPILTGGRVDMATRRPFFDSESIALKTVWR